MNVLAEIFFSENKTCYECELYKAKNDKLSRALQNFINCENRLNDMLNNQ